MKVAIVYDRVNKWGGAERVLLVLHEMFPEAALYTSVYNPETAKWAEAFPKVVPSFLNKVSYFRKRHEMLAFLMPMVFESFCFDGYDLVISVTSEAAKGIVTKPGTKHICICLTPTRYLWSHYNEYFSSLVKLTIFKPIISYLKRWDRIAAQRPDVMVGISTEVQKRIKKYYRRESKLVYPPVSLEKYGEIASPRASHNDIGEDYFLVVSRLVKYKKVDLVVEAFNELGKKLVVVGGGVEEKKLKRIAGKNIEFVKGLTERELARCYKNCTALIAAQREDFGLVMIEAMSFGKPVIAYRKGGGKEIVEDGKTGVFFDTQDKESIIEATRRFEKLTFDRRYIENRIVRFSKERFKKEMFELINKFVTLNIIF